MNQTNSSLFEVVKTMQMNIGKTIQTFGKVPKANIALRKGTETNNVLRNKIRIKNEIEATTNSPISCLKLVFLAIFLMICFYLFINYG